MKYKNYIKNLFPIFSLLLIFLLVSFISKSRFEKETPLQTSLDFSGTNGLFIEYKNGLQFNWITNKADSGYFELSTSDKTIIKKGTTKIGRSHSVHVNHEIKEPVYLKIGGKDEPRQSIQLRKKTTLENANYKNVDTMYVVGDVHGRFNELTQLLQKSRIIDAELNWIAGSSHLIFLGDIFDRGDDVTKVLWFIYELEAKAMDKGGKVHLVLGNHEIMVMSKDLRYLSRKENSIPIAHGVTYDYLFHPNKSFLGEWLSKKASVIKIDDIIFAHGGIVDLGTPSIDEFNRTSANYMQHDAFLDLMQEHPDTLKYSKNEWYTIQGHFYDKNSPYWYRGYVYQDTLAPQLNFMLRKYKAKIHVVAHTPQETITERYKGKLLTTDLNEAATELLLLVKNRKKYNRFKINQLGEKSKLN